MIGEMMKDSVLSVRIDESLKQQFMNLAQENGVNNKELMELMVAQYHLNQSTHSDQQAVKEVEELTRLTKRMVDLYAGMIDRHQLKMLEVVNQESNLVTKKEEQIVTLEAKVTELLEKNTELTTLKDQITALKDQVKGLKEEEENVKDLNHLLRDKNKDLETKVSEYTARIQLMQTSADQVTVLNAALEDQQQLVSTLKSQKEDLQHENEQVIERFNTQAATFEREKEAFHKTLTKQFELELTQQLLALKVSHQEEIQQQKEQAHHKVEELLAKNEALMLQLQEALMTKHSN